MIIDVIDDIEVKKNIRSDGTVYSVYSFARKLGQAAANGLTGLLLSIVGYSSATAFDSDVVNGIYDVTTLSLQLDSWFLQHHLHSSIHCQRRQCRQM